MRDGSLRRLSLPAALVLAAMLPGRSSSAAEPGDSGARIELEPPEQLQQGDRTQVVATAHLPPDTQSPLLVTPSSEGTAFDVVRGRLLRSDAEEPEQRRTLRFKVPIVARSSGTSVIRVRLLAYVCSHRCRAVRAEASEVLRVRR
jgi:hypothetical protein